MMRKLPQWELTLIVLTLAAGAWSAYLSPYYLSFDQIADSTRHFVFPGILAIGLAVVVILGEIDISLASTLAFGAVLFSKFSAFGVPIWIATPLVIAACAALGALNGVLVARLALPSLAVTLGTMGAFRGLAFILGRRRATPTSTIPTSMSDRSRRSAPCPSRSSSSLSSRSRSAFSCGAPFSGAAAMPSALNKEASWAAGIDVARIKIQAYTLAGALAGVAALVWIGQYGSARGDNADGAILFVVTAVVLGGLDINGGRGADPRRGACALPARHDAQWHGPRQHRRADADDRARRTA